MSSDITYLEPLLGVGVQNLLDQVLRRLRYEARNQVVAVYDLLIQLARVRVLKRQVAAHHRIQNDAAAPDVRVQTLVSLASDHLRSSVARTATSRFEGVAFVVGVRQTEVNDFDVVLVVEQQVLWLQVAVTDAHLVDVLDARDDLLHKPARLLFLQALALHDVVEQLAARRVLHDQEKLPRRLDDLAKLESNGLTS